MLDNWVWEAAIIQSPSSKMYIYVMDCRSQFHFLGCQWIVMAKVEAQVVPVQYIFSWHLEILYQQDPDRKFMGPTWGPSGADRTQVGPMLAPWTLLSGDCIAWLYAPGYLRYNADIFSDKISPLAFKLSPRFLPEASIGLRVLSLPASVCLCVCVCVCVCPSTPSLSAP